MFFYTLLLFLRSTLLLNRNKHICEEFVFLYVCIFLNTFTVPCPVAASAATCVLCNIYKLSIFTDMIIEIHITKPLAKLPRESHWR